MATRWTWLGRRVLFGAGLLLVLTIVVPPARLHSLDLETSLAEHLGYPVHIESAHWRWDPGPTVELRDAVAYPGGFHSLPVAIRARQVLLKGIPSLLGDESGAYGEIELAGLDLSLGPLGLRDAMLKLEAAASGLHVQGRAYGAHGGSVEISGALGEADPTLNPLRVYMAQLDLPILELLPALAGIDQGPVRFTGVVTVTGDLEQRQEFDFDLDGVGLRRESSGSWLQTKILGRLVRKDGRFQSGEALHIRSEVRDLDASRELRAMHGGVDLELALTGDAESGRLVLDANMEKLRLRLANLLEKPADSPGSAHYEAYWAPKGRGGSLGTLELGGLRLRLDRTISGSSSTWRLRSGSLPLAELRAYVPALQVLPESVQGQLVLDIVWRPEHGIAGEVTLHDIKLDLGSRSIKIPSGRIDLTPDAARFQAPRLLLAGQSMSVDGTLEWLPATGRTHVSLILGADDLDLEPIMDLTAPLWARGGDDSTPDTSEDIAVAVVQALRAKPRLLARLQINPAILEVGHITGFGLDATHARYRLELVDQVLRLEEGERSSQVPEHRYALDLQSWVPKLTSN